IAAPKKAGPSNCPQKESRISNPPSPAGNGVLDPTIHAPNWYACVGRGYIRAWPRYVQSNSDVRRIYPPPPPLRAIEFGCPPDISAPGPVTCNRIRMSAGYIRPRPRYVQSNSGFRPIFPPPPPTRATEIRFA